MAAMPDNKAIKADAIDSASLAHGFATLCASDGPLLHRLWLPQVHQCLLVHRR